MKCSYMFHDIRSLDSMLMKQPVYTCHGRKSNLESPIGISTNINLVESPIAVSTGRQSNLGDLGIAQESEI